MWLKTKDAVLRYGRSRQYLNKLNKTKGLLIRKVGRTVEYDTDSYDEYIGYTNGKPKKVKKHIPQSISQKTEPPAKRSTGGNKHDSSSEDKRSLVDVDIELKEEKVIFERLKNKKEQEKSIDRAETEDLFFQIGRNVRDAFESIPSRAATICVGKTRHEIEQILTEEIKQALSNLVLNL